MGYSSVVYSGLWGDWKDWAYAPTGSFFCGGQVRFEDSRGSKDDTAANGLKLISCDRDDWDTQSTILIYEGNWGSWKDIVMCPSGSFIHGGRVRFEGAQGSSGDDTALNGLQIRCKAPAVTTYAA